MLNPLNMTLAPLFVKQMCQRLYCVLVKFIDVKYNLLQNLMVTETRGALTGCSAEQILASEVRNQVYSI